MSNNGNAYGTPDCGVCGMPDNARNIFCSKLVVTNPDGKYCAFTVSREHDTGYGVRADNEKDISNLAKLTGMPEDDVLARLIAP